MSTLYGRVCFSSIPLIRRSIIKLEPRSVAGWPCVFVDEMCPFDMLNRPTRDRYTQARLPTKLCHCGSRNCSTPFAGDHLMEL